MASPPAERRIKAELLSLVRCIPGGRVATLDVIARQLGVIPNVVLTLLSGLSDDERQIFPWHRVVAKGGAVGRGPHRDAQFARLVREGVPMSPAGIVQDMGRVAVSSLDPMKPDFMTDQTADRAQSPAAPPPAPLSRSRGMKDRPG